jgi:nicotinate-nucleotide pyrophosphorylase (carboxylating)
MKGNLENLISKAFAEDLENGDYTSEATIPSVATGRARLIIKQPGILCGIPVAEKVFSFRDHDLVMRVYMEDGMSVKPGDIAFEVEGRIISILACERIVLNFMQRLSGIATATSRLVGLIEGFHTKILDTRKTTPGFRDLEKYAVRTGGGTNHRMGLYDMIMIKDNHVDYAGSLEKAIDRVHAFLRNRGLDLRIEVEVRDLSELKRVIEHGGIDRIMLDNFSPQGVSEAVAVIAGRFETEASGGITEANIRDYAASGVDFISVGSLTHHIQSLDMSLKAVRD